MVRSVRVSVPDLAIARQSYVDALGLEVVEDRQLHTPEDEAMWGLAGAEADSLLLRVRLTTVGCGF